MKRFNITITAEDNDSVGFVLSVITDLIMAGYKEGMGVDEESGNYAFKSEDIGD